MNESPTSSKATCPICKLFDPILLREELRTLWKMSREDEQHRLWILEKAVKSMIGIFSDLIKGWGLDVPPSVAYKDVVDIEREEIDKKI